MKQLYTLIFILIIPVNILIANNNYHYLAVEKIKLGAFVLPTATITTSNSAVCSNETQPIVTFTGSGGVAPYTFTYKINGGLDIITSQSIGNSVTLNAPTNVVGSFEYKLVSVKDSSGATQSQTSSTTITVSSLPVVNFTFTNDNSCSGTAVQFNSNVTGSGTYTYAWDFGDGSTSVLQNPSYVFNNTNGNTTQSFNVTLKITNTNGCVNSITKTISIKSPGATLNSNVDSDTFNGFPIFKVCTNDISQIDFINTSITSSTDTNCVIDWGDTTPNFTATTFSATSHTYSVGLWTLTYTVTGQDGCVTTRIYKVFVGNNPAVGIGNPGNTNICISSPLTFPITGTENNPPGTIYTITFNDGSDSTTFNHPPPASITHTFLKSSCGVTSSGLQNSFSATIKASNPCDVSFGYVIPIRVSEPPVANFTLPQTKVCTNTQVCFTDSSTGGATATNSSCVNPKIVWSISPLTGFTLNSGTLGSDNNGSENTSTWTFGTNSICPVFSVPGTYTITLKTGNSCEIDEIVKTICVEAPPVPIFTLSTTDGCGPLSVSTTNTTDTTNSCDTTYLWDVTYTAANCGTTSSYNYISGSSTSASPVFSFENPGIYSITLTATNSCGSFTSAAQTITVKQPPIVVVNAIATNCVNSPITPSVLVNSCSTTPNSALEYLWTFTGGTPSTSTSVTPPMVSYAIPGNYSIKLDVKNECGTTSAISNTFTINPIPIIQNETKSICNSSSFIITPSVLTAGNVIPSGTTFSWGAPVVTGGITGGQSGTNQTTINGTLTNPTNAVQTATYIVTPSSGDCPGMPFIVIINVSSQIVITTSQTNVSCFGESDGTATATATAGTTPYTYSWDTTPVQNSATATGLAEGTYTVTVTDASSCTNSQTITITQPMVLNASISAQTDVSCFGGSNGSATVLATGGTAPYTYSWNTSPVQTSATASVLLAGTYIVTITDSKGCSKTQSVTINQPSAVLDSSISAQTNVSCFGSNTGSATVSVTGGTAPYLYSWNTIPVQTSPTAVGLIAGTYTVTITDAKGCSKNQSVTISQPATGLTAAISSQTNLTCFGGNNGSATVTASGGVGGLTYSWNTNPVQTLATANGLKAGTYTVTVKDENNCSKTEQVIITQPNEIVITTSQTNVSCFGDSDGTATATATAGTTPYAYSWNTIPVQTTAKAIGLSVGTYTVTVTDANSCKKSQTITITQPMVLDASISAQTDVSCFGSNTGSATVLTTGGTAPYSYSWNTSPVQTLATASGLLAGTYIVTITDSKGCSKAKSVTINQPSAVLDSSISAQTDVSCFGSNTGSATILATGGTAPYLYSWNTIPVQTSSVGSGLSAGTYTVTITDAKGCSKNQSVTISQPATGLTAAISSQTNLTCFGGNNGSATITASGGVGVLTYSWNTNPVQTLATANGLKAGTYTVTVQDENNCSKTEQVIITQPNEIVISGVQTNVSCFGENDGTATVSVTGGTAPYAYSWNTISVQTAAKATGLAVGTYVVTVTDVNGCFNTHSVTITQPLLGLSSSISNSNNVSCSGGNNGNATVLATGGTAPYSYSWNTSPIQNLATATELTAGTYTVSVTDFNGCSTSSSITITEPVGVTATINQTNVLCAGDNTGSATVFTTGGVGSYSYSWDTIPIQNSSTATNLKAGIYTVTISDENNCSITKQVTITEPNGIITSISSQTNVTCFGDNTGAATILASGGNGTLSYSWNTIPINTTATATGLSAGKYAVTVTDANNCSKIQIITITEPNDILITTDLKKDISCFGNANGSIAITITGGTPNYTFAWTKNGTAYETTEDLSNLGPGVYEVTVSDANNCVPKTAIFTIVEPPILALNLVSQTNILCFGDASGAITTNVVGGNAPYTYAWTGPNGFTSSIPNLIAILAGTYSLKVTDNSGCSVNLLPVTITQPLEISIVAATSPIICYGGNDASIDLTISGGISPYQTVWDTMATGTFQDNLSAGDYVITVTDASGCEKKITVNIPNPPVFSVNPIVKQISCFGAKDASINLNLVGGLSPVKLVWNDGSTSGLTRNNLGPGTYIATITDGKPCVITKTFIIQEPQPLVVGANITNALDCSNANSGAINLLVSGGTAPYSYVWNNGSVTEDLNNVPGGNYMVTVTDSRGCVQTKQYVITRPDPISIDVSTQLIFDCNVKTVSLKNIALASGGVPPFIYDWSSGTVSGIDKTVMETDQNGVVILMVTDALGCSANKTLNIDVPKIGGTSFTSSSYANTTYGSYSIQDPIQFANTATGDYETIVWDFGDGSVSNEENPIHTFVKEGNYVVTQTVAYAFGCEYKYTITLKIDKGYKLITPNGFTPNDDGINETFKPVFIGITSIQLDVYDTWGELIYTEIGETLRGWDGKIKGKESENGNYYYKVKASTFYGGIINENGPFTLIK